MSRNDWVYSVLVAVVLAIFSSMLGQLLGMWSVTVRHCDVTDMEEASLGEGESEGWVVVRSGDTVGSAHWYVDEATGTVVADEFYLEAKG